MDHWWEVCIACSTEAREAFAHLLMEAGSPGVAEQAAPDTGDPTEVCGYYRRLGPGDVADLAAAASRMGQYGLHPGSARIRVRRVPTSDWAHGWKAYYRPLRFGDRLVVRPSWARCDPAPGEVVITMDPGMAFGTGTHPTTAQCLQALLRLVEPGTRLADIGTGSGILAIAAARLGATVVAVDTDPEAVTIARRNARLNGVSARISVRTGSVEVLEDLAPFDLVVSNLTTDLIVRLCRPVSRLVKADGRWIASGIVSGRAASVRRALVGAGWDVEEVHEEGEWVSLRSRKRQHVGGRGDTGGGRR